MRKPLLGRQLILELYDCPPGLLDNIPNIEMILLDVVEKAGATFVDKSFHHFSPQGVSGVVVIAESHLAIHTWPEHGYAALDVFTCDPRIDYNLIEDLLVSGFKSGRHHAQMVGRGSLAQIHAQAV